MTTPELRTGRTGQAVPAGASPVRRTATPAAPSTSTSASASAGSAAGSATPPDPRRWIALAVVATAQLMIALDATIMNVALPSAQRALAFSDTSRQWIITAYTVSFGGLLLLGGRIADLVGRRRTFFVGLAGFAGASALGGAASGLGPLIAARALQGGFAALLAPTVLSAMAVTFTAPRERAKAFAIFGAIAGGGGALGLVLGGLLAEHLSWRWCLYVNVPIAAAAAVGGAYALRAAGPTQRPRLDLPGAALVTGGLVAVVYACSQSPGHGWGSADVLGALAAGIVALALFVLVESRVASPLLPLRVLRDRNRAGVYAAVGCAVAGMLGLFLFLTYYLQVVLEYSPVRAGMAFLPLSAAVFASSQLIGAKLLPRVAPRVLIVPGLLVAAAAMGMLTQLSAGDGYVGQVLPAEILLGLGMGCVFVPAINTATQHVDRRDMGVAAAVVNTSQQVGGSIGVALLNAVAGGATAHYLAARTGGGPRVHTDALVHGYAVAAGAAAGILAVAALLAALLITARAPERQASGAH